MGGGGVSTLKSQACGTPKAQKLFLPELPEIPSPCQDVGTRSRPSCPPSSAGRALNSTRLHSTGHPGRRRVGREGRARTCVDPARTLLGLSSPFCFSLSRSPSPLTSAEGQGPAPAPKRAGGTEPGTCGGFAPRSYLRPWCRRWALRCCRCTSRSLSRSCPCPDPVPVPVPLAALSVPMPVLEAVRMPGELPLTTRCPAPPPVPFIPPAPRAPPLPSPPQKGRRREERENKVSRKRAALGSTY